MFYIIKLIIGINTKHTNLYLHMLTLIGNKTGVFPFVFSTKVTQKSKKNVHISFKEYQCVLYRLFYRQV